MRMQMRRDQRQKFIRIIAVAFITGPTAERFDLDRRPVTRHVIPQIARIAEQHLLVLFGVGLLADAAGLAVGALPRGRQDLLGEFLGVVPTGGMHRSRAIPAYQQSLSFIRVLTMMTQTLVQAHLIVGVIDVMWKLDVENGKGDGKGYQAFSNPRSF